MLSLVEVCELCFCCALESLKEDSILKISGDVMLVALLVVFFVENDEHTVLEKQS